MLIGSIGFDAALSQNRRKSIFGDPVLVSLSDKAPYDSLTFLASDRLIQVKKYIGCPKISITFDDFVYQDQMVSKCVPSQVRYQPVVLMENYAIRILSWTICRYI